MELSRRVPHNQGAHRPLGGPVVRKLRIDHIRRTADHKQIRVGEQRKFVLLKNLVKHLFLIKQKHTLPVKIPEVVAKLPFFGKIAVRIDCRHKLVIRIRIIECIFMNAGLFQNLFQSMTRKGTRRAPCMISFQSGKIGSQVILPASCPVL